MITLGMLKALANNDGMTLKNYEPVTYKSGYQVATEGLETRSAARALAIISKYNGNCGVWYSDGIYYIDKSHRVSTKKEAIRVGLACKQKSILKWADMSLLWI